MRGVRAVRRLRRGVEVRVLGAAAARSSSYIFDHRSFRGWRDDSATRPAGSKGWLAGKEEGRSHRPEEEEEGRGGGAVGDHMGTRRKKTGGVARSA
jgi:hypothetical protein